MTLSEVLLVIDMQNGLIDTVAFAEVLGRINNRLIAYHQAQQPVIFMQHTDDELVYGSWNWQLATGLRRWKFAVYRPSIVWTPRFEWDIHGALKW